MSKKTHLSKTASFVTLLALSLSANAEQADDNTQRIQAVKQKITIDSKAAGEKAAEVPQLVTLDHFKVQIHKIKARTESAQAGMQKPIKIHHLTLKLTTTPTSKTHTEFATPEINIVDAQGKVKVIHTHAYSSNTDTARKYQYNLSRPTKDATVTINFKNSQGKIVTATTKVSFPEPSVRFIKKPSI